MTIADDTQNPRPQKKLDKSLDAIAALRAAMEQRLAEVRQETASRPVESSVYEPIKPTTAPSFESEEAPVFVSPAVLITESKSGPKSEPKSVTQPEPIFEPEATLPDATPLEAVTSEAITSKAVTPDAVPMAAEAMAPEVHVQPEEQVHIEPEPVSKPSSMPGPTFKAEAPPKPRAEKRPQAEEPQAQQIPPLPQVDLGEMSRTLLQISERWQKLMLDFLKRNKKTPMDFVPPFDPNHITEAIGRLSQNIVANPARFIDAQLNLWQGYAKIWQSTIKRMQGKAEGDFVKPPAADKRFQDVEWQSNLMFDCLKQAYLLTAEQVQDWVKHETSQLDPSLARKLDFYTRQFVDAMSPSNFWMTNPEVMRAVMASKGENLIKGFENLLTDFERGNGTLRINMTDTMAFEVGKNIATTPGKVIYQNRLMQLIQYTPQTETVHQVPLLIIPPWINKYYILDLRAKNSYIGYLVSQGHTVFVVSWVNPDASLAEVGFDDYMSEGALQAMRTVKKITGESQINTVGYCIGGTLLATTLAYLKGLPIKADDIPEVASATYLVTMTDFREPGDLGVFIDEDMLKLAEERMSRQGYFDGATMAAVFNSLRANDLVWSFVVKNYLLGKEPMPFDLLYWNSDSTNLPAAMQRYYLRNMYQANKLVEPCALSMKGIDIDLTTIDTPSFMLSTREDHIAPWKSTYAATQLYKGDVKFVLAGSGHIAGVINAPTNGKYGYWSHEGANPAKPEDWLSRADRREGSWWPEWLRWLDRYAGPQVTARMPENALEDAPGSYVMMKSAA